MSTPWSRIDEILTRCSYDTLKKFIYQLEKQQQQHNGLSDSYHDLEANETSALVGGTTSTTDALFVPLLDQELKKIVLFYESQENELFEELNELEEMVKRQEDAGFEHGGYYMDDIDEDDDDDDSVSGSRGPAQRRRRLSSSAGRNRRNSSSIPSMWPSTSLLVSDTFLGGSVIPEEPREHRYSISSDEYDAGLEESTTSLTGTGTKRALSKLTNRIKFVKDSVSSPTSDTIWTAKTNYAYDTRLLFKRRITTLYIAFTSLRSYVEINYSGFRKILKKYDKITYSELKDRYMHDVVESAVPFTPGPKDRLNDGISRLVDLYTKCTTQGDKTAARQQLKLHQREKIAWERDTVWRQMIGRERRGDVDGAPTILGGSLVKEAEPGLLDVATPVGRFKLTRRLLWMIVGVIVFVVMLNVDIVDGMEANRCLAILTFCTILWATEVSYSR